MHISTEGKLGLLVGLLALAGGGAVWVAPDHKEIGWFMIALAAVGGIALATHHFSDMLAPSRTPRARRKVIALLGMIFSGAVFIGSAAFYFWPTQPDERAAIARLSELGWAVKRNPDGIQFEIADRSLRSMKDSAIFFRQLTTPFRLLFQRAKDLDGLHYLSDINTCTKIEILAGEFTDISELSGFQHLENLTIDQLPLNGFDIVDPSPLTSLVNLKELVLSMTRIRDLQFLANFGKLTKLMVGQTLVADLSPISGIASVEDLDIRGTRVKNLQPLSSYQNLKSLMIGAEQILS